MKTRTALKGGAALLALLLTTPSAFPEAADTDWPQFRGHHRDGISRETGLLDSWTETAPGEVWRVEIGEGFSGMSVVGEHLYTMYAGMEGERAVEYAAAFNTTSGKEVWKTIVGDKLDTEFGNGPRATPTVDGDMVYVLGSHGDLIALDRKSGASKWTLSLTETFGSERPHWGFSTSALIDGEKLIIEGGGGEGKSYAALNKMTGEQIWTSGDGRPGHSSALAVDMGGERRYVYVAGGVLRCIDEDGNEVWNHPWPQGETHAIPLFIAPNRIYASGAEGVGATLLEVSMGAEGEEVAELWKDARLRNHFSASVVHDGNIYGFDNATLKSVSAETGELNWAKRGLGKGSLILADGDLLILSDSGALVQVKATPEAYTETGRVQALEGRSWTAPTLANGKLYVRNHTEMVSFDLKG